MDFFYSFQKFPLQILNVVLWRNLSLLSQSVLLKVKPVEWRSTAEVNAGVGCVHKYFGA